jgi:hypothetical protein
VRKIAALAALSRSRAISASELESFSVQPNLWPTSAVIDWYQILQRSPSCRSMRSAWEADQILRSRLNLQGTTMTFSTERTDDWWWLMSSADSNANRLLLVMADNPAWKDDIGRLARGALGRQQKGRWGTTVANAWGVLAIDKFSQLFEKTRAAAPAPRWAMPARASPLAATRPAARPCCRGRAAALVRWNWSTPARASRG